MTTPSTTTTNPSPKRRRVLWPSFITVMSAAILIAAEVFGAAYAGGWAFANLFDLGENWMNAMRIIFSLGGLYVMTLFVRNAYRAEPFFVYE